mgnify:CR=1 FL=1
MKLLRLEAKNFCTLGDVNVRLDQPGLVLITGQNLDADKADSNGAGKSLLFEAICWALWGSTVRGLDGDAVVNEQVGRDCIVSVEFEDGGKTYLVRRHRLDSQGAKPNDVYVFCDGVMLTSSGKMKQTQEIINRVVGFDFDTFRALMPGAGIKVANLTDKEVKQLFESILKTEQLSEAHERAKTRLKELQAEKALLSSQLTAARQLLTQKEAELDRLVTINTQAEQRKNERLSRIAKRIETCEVEYREKLNALSEIKGEGSETDDIKKLLALTASDAAALSRVEKESERDQALLLQKQKQLSTSRARFESLHGECSLCNQVVPDEHKQKHVSLLEQSLEEVGDQLQKLALKVSQTKDALEVLSKRKATLQRTLSEAEERHRQAQTLAADLRRLEDFLRDLRAEQNAVLSEVTDVSDHVQQVVASATGTVTQICVEFLPKLASVDAEIALCGFWVTAFSPKGLRSFMLDYVVPVLNDRAKYYCDILTNGEMSVSFSTKEVLKNGESKENFSILVSQKKGSTSYTGASTGERARADLVIAMVLGDLAQLRTAKTLTWRFLDEPFESIDKSGTQAIVRLLEDQRTRYDTVFVVTHQQQFKDLFSSHMTVVKKNGITKVSSV